GQSTGTEAEEGGKTDALTRALRPRPPPSTWAVRAVGASLQVRLCEPLNVQPYSADTSDDCPQRPHRQIGGRQVSREADQGTHQQLPAPGFGAKHCLQSFSQPLLLDGVPRRELGTGRGYPFNVSPFRHYRPERVGWCRKSEKDRARRSRADPAATA